MDLPELPPKVNKPIICIEIKPREQENMWLSWNELVELERMKALMSLAIPREFFGTNKEKDL